MSRKKAKPRPKWKVLHDKAWALMSEFVRKRDGGVCITCGARNWNEELGEASIKGMQAGHFKHGVLDFDPININCQCVQCNFFNSGNLSVYALRLIEKYGLEKIQDLERRAEQAKKEKHLSVEEYEQLITKLRAQIAKLP